MNTVIETHALGRLYGRRWALRDCMLSVPAGPVVGLVGPNGGDENLMAGNAMSPLLRAFGWLVTAMAATVGAVYLVDLFR